MKEGCLSNYPGGRIQPTVDQKPLKNNARTNFYSGVGQEVLEVLLKSRSFFPPLSE